MPMNVAELKRRFEASPEIVPPPQNISWIWSGSSFLPRWTWKLRMPTMRIPPEMEAALEIARAVRDGDEGRARQLIEAFVGRPLDPILTEAYGAETWAELTDWESGMLPALVWFLEYHGERMKTEPNKWYKERTEYVYHKLKKLDDRDLVRLLKREDEGRAERLERLRGELPGAIMAAETQGYFGRYVVRPVERRIIKDNRLLRDTRKKIEPSWEGGSTDKIVALPQDARGLYGERAHRADASPEDQYLEAFAEMEKERRRDRDSDRFTKTENRIAEFLRHEYAHPEGGPTPEQAIALEFGLANSTARVHVKNMKDKFSA